MTLHPGQRDTSVLEVKLPQLGPSPYSFPENIEWFQDLIENTQDLLCVHDLQGRLLAVNRAPARLLGYTVEEILLVPMRELIVPEYRKEFDDYLQRIEREGHVRGLLVALTRSGERVTWEFRNTLQRDRNGHPIVSGIARDVTEQRRAEKRLAGQSARLKILADASKAFAEAGQDYAGVLKLVACQVAAVLADVCLVRLLDSNEKSLELAATYGLTAEQLEMLRHLGPLPLGGPDNASVTARVFRSGELRLVPTITAEPAHPEITPECWLHHDGSAPRSYIIVPLQVHGGRIGVLTLIRHRSERPAFTEDDLSLARDLADSAALAISNARLLARVQDELAERKRAEEALRASERRQCKIAEQLDVERRRLVEAQAVAKVGSWEVELPSLEITWSEQTHRIFETDPSHFHPKRPDFSRFIHVEDRATVDAAFQASLDNGAPSSVEYRIVVADGRVKALEEQWRVFHDEKGLPIRLMGTCHDVTQSKHAEGALHRSEEQYRMFVSQSSEGIFREEMDVPVAIDLPENELIHHILHDGYIAECNDALAAMYGLTSADELLGRHWREMMPTDDPQNVEMNRQFVRLGFRLLEHKSHEVDIHGNPKVFLNSLIGTVEDGRLVRTWGIQRDITEKVKLEEARHKAEENLQANLLQLEEVAQQLRQAKEKLALEKLYLEEEIDTDLGFGEIIGRADELKRVMEKVKKVAPSEATVLLLGETGTGKELVARELHRRSNRAGKSFIKMNCAAIPSGLLESELFGHEKGAFTGAGARKLGRIELADGGTLFLDEIGEISLSLQPKLLRVLQDMEFERLGGTQTIKVNFRLLAATNRELAESVKAREFRSDLYYRLNVFPIHIPPLRARREDIRLLVEHFVRKFSVQMKKKITHIPSKTMEALVRGNWPGNIRELENFVERSVILTPGSVLQSPLIELDIGALQPDGATLYEVDRDRIVRTLRDCHGKLGGADGAAARLGLKRTTLQSKLDHLGIRPAEFRA